MISRKVLNAVGDSERVWTANPENVVDGTNNVDAIVDFTPLSPQSGNLLFAVFAWDGNGSVTSPAAGWTEVYESVGFSFPSILVWTKISDGTETTVDYGGTQVRPFAGAAIVASNGSYSSVTENKAATSYPDLIANPNQLAGEQVLCLVAGEDQNTALTDPSSGQVLANELAYSTTNSGIAFGASVYTTVSDNETPPAFTRGGVADGAMALTIRIV